MSKPRTLGLFSLVLGRGEKSDRVGKPGSSRMACLVALFCVAAAISSLAQTFTTLANFDNTGGFYPAASLAQGLDGNFYGTTNHGGSNCFSCGTLFKISPRGLLKTLFNFGGIDGQGPVSALMLATNGNFFGTTNETVFEITPAGKLTTLHSFNGTGSFAALLQAANGNFYGTDETGGTQGLGSVFELTPGGTLTTLHSFDGTDGANPFAPLVQAPNGILYGTTRAGGGSQNCSTGCGTVFSITPGGGMFTTMHSFDLTDGSTPAGLVLGTDGNLYGTTSFGGASQQGTVFAITPGGTLTTLHSFDGTDGQGPSAALVQATDGNLYGTTEEGGKSCPGGQTCGTVFEITPGGTLTTLHQFDGTDGNDPRAGLLQATDGNFYGTTYYGGSIKNCGLTTCGTVFKLSVGLGPFVTTVPTSGNLGRRVIILGTNLTGTTSVTFNGTAAAFTVVSATEITTTVPTGATTGTVQVTTPSGPLSSNVVFGVP
jgi:uncharacterized repeat protein (TIGR03803 family)